MRRLSALPVLALLAWATAASAQQDDPGGRWEFFLEQRRSPGVPGWGARLQVARESVLRRAVLRLPPGAAGARVGASDAWKPLGPEIIESYAISTGRVSAVVLHPANMEVILAGGAQGGVWRTENAGAAWRPLTDQECSLAMGALALDPVNPDIVYAGTGEQHFSADSYYGCGVLRSADGGESWTRLGEGVFTGPMGGTTISRIVVDSATAGTLDATTVYAATEGGLFISTDSGAGWTQVLDGVVTDLLVHAGDRETMFAAVAEGEEKRGHATLHRSGDAGWSWREFDPGLGTLHWRAQLAQSLSSPDVLYLSAGESEAAVIARSSDGGESWTRMPAVGLRCGQCWYNQSLAVHPADPDVVYFGGRAAVPLGQRGRHLLDPRPHRHPRRPARPHRRCARAGHAPGGQRRRRLPEPGPGKHLGKPQHQPLPDPVLRRGLHTSARGGGFGSGGHPGQRHGRGGRRSLLAAGDGRRRRLHRARPALRPQVGRDPVAGRDRRAEALRQRRFLPLPRMGHRPRRRCALHPSAGDGSLRPGRPLLRNRATVPDGRRRRALGADRGGPRRKDLGDRAQPLRCARGLFRDVRIGHRRDPGWGRNVAVGIRVAAHALRERHRRASSRPRDRVCGVLGLRHGPRLRHARLRRLLGRYHRRPARPSGQRGAARSRRLVPNLHRDGPGRVFFDGRWGLGPPGRGAADGRGVRPGGGAGGGRHGGRDPRPGRVRASDGRAPGGGDAGGAGRCGSRARRSGGGRRAGAYLRYGLAGRPLGSARVGGRVARADAGGGRRARLDPVARGPRRPPTRGVRGDGHGGGCGGGGGGGARVGYVARWAGGPRGWCWGGRGARLRRGVRGWGRARAAGGAGGGVGGWWQRGVLRRYYVSGGRGRAWSGRRRAVGGAGGSAGGAGGQHARVPFGGPLHRSAGGRGRDGSGFGRGGDRRARARTGGVACDPRGFRVAGTGRLGRNGPGSGPVDAAGGRPRGRPVPGHRPGCGGRAVRDSRHPRGLPPGGGRDHCHGGGAGRGGGHPGGSHRAPGGHPGRGGGGVRVAHGHLDGRAWRVVVARTGRGARGCGGRGGGAPHPRRPRAGHLGGHDPNPGGGWHHPPVGRGGRQPADRGGPPGRGGRIGRVRRTRPGRGAGPCPRPPRKP